MMEMDNLVEYVVINVGLIAKTRKFIIDCDYLRRKDFIDDKIEYLRLATNARIIY